MMLGPILLALMSFLFTICSACPSDNVTYTFTTNMTTNSTNHLKPRYWSVPATSGEGTILGPWPVTTYDAVNGNQAHIPYCYVDAKSVGKLPALMGEAFSNWKTAIDKSALDFVPDCENGILECECSPNTSPNTLRIKAVNSADTPGIPPGGGRATVGYGYDSSVAGRQTLEIADYDPMDFGPNHPKSVLMVAHELGHVLGLAHEHQRPSRGEDLTFYCVALRGYWKAVNDVAKAKQNPDKDRPLPNECLVNCSPKCCMDRYICQVPAYANAWFPAALQYTIGPTHDSDKDFVEGPDITTTSVDHESIMIYGSYNFAENRGTFPKGSVLTWRERGWSEDFEIFLGGNANPALAGPSAGDVDRVVELYPKNIVKVSGSDGW
ncbi:hypothetical protein LTS10_009750 [Elasticomyces elasticus]|nr:hypothetical protein LTS10_009750 [Elasticomyces elasticus]